MEARKETDFGMRPDYSNDLTETQRKQIAFLWKMNAVETIASRTRYQLRCKDCGTCDYHSVAAMVIDNIEWFHRGHKTWLDKY
jgi:hypothetical protein